MKKIPKAFQMGPHRIEVKIVPFEELQKHPMAQGGVLFGLCDYCENTIYVAGIHRRHPKSMQFHTFWHEYFHMLFDKACRPRLAKDEGLVDMCGLLHLQAMNTLET